MVGWHPWVHEASVIIDRVRSYATLDCQPYRELSKQYTHTDANCQHTSIYVLSLHDSLFFCLLAAAFQSERKRLDELSKSEKMCLDRRSWQKSKNRVKISWQMVQWSGSLRATGVTLVSLNFYDFIRQYCAARRDPCAAYGSKNFRAFARQSISTKAQKHSYNPLLCRSVC